MVENRVREYRLAAGLTMVQLARLSGLSLSTISDIENGAEPRVVTALCLANALSVPVEKLWPLKFRQTGIRYTGNLVTIPQDLTYNDR